MMPTHLVELSNEQMTLIFDLIQAVRPRLAFDQLLIAGDILNAMTISVVGLAEFKHIWNDLHNKD